MFRWKRTFFLKCRYDIATLPKKDSLDSEKKALERYLPA
jgi:hypothetical protein